MKSGLLLIFTFLLPLALVRAENPVFECKAQKTLADMTLLQKVQSAYAGIRSLKAYFIQNSFLSSLEASEDSSGEVWFVKPGQMRWHYKDPEPQDFVVKDQTVWLYQKADNQVFIDNFRDVLISDLPVSFLMGIGDLAKDFKLKESCQNKDGIVLKLEPISKKEDSTELESFRLLVDAQNYLPRGAMVSDVSANVTSIVLRGLELDGNIAASVFSTDFGSSVDLIDRRHEGKANG